MDTIRSFDLDEYEEHVQLDMSTELTEFSKLKIKAQKRAIEDKLTQYYKKMIDEEHYQVFSRTAALILPTLHELKQQTDNILDVKNGKNEFCFFTINFKPEFDNHFDVIYDIFQTWINKCKFTKDDYIYSIEQRSETSDTYTGIHIHVLFRKYDNSPSKIQRAFTMQFFDKYVGTNAALDFKYVSDPAKKIKYIMGVKEKSKMPKVYIDRKMKDENNQPYWYATERYNIDIDNTINSDEYKQLFSHTK